MLAVLDQQNIMPELSDILAERAERIMAALSMEDTEVSLVLCDDTEIRELNRKWRDIDQATDVLSFPLDPELLEEDPDSVGVDISSQWADLISAPETGDASVSVPTAPIVQWSGDVEPGYQEPGEMFPRILGDVVISVETCLQQAQEYSHTPLDEATRLFIHGLLHLCGYDHQTPEDATQMREKEEELLQLFAEPGLITPLVATTSELFEQK